MRRLYAFLTALAIVVSCMAPMTVVAGATGVDSVDVTNLTQESTATNTHQEVAPAVVADGTCGESLTWTLTEDGTLTISGTGNMGSSAYWNEQKGNIKVVIIESGVTSIGGYAFSGCESLTSVAIPDGVTGIGDNAFQDCSGLTGITIPDSVTQIGSFAFMGCSHLTSITIPDGVTSIGVCTFDSCRRLASIMIPDSVARIEEMAFSGCSSLTDVFYAGTEAQKDQIVIESNNDALTSATWHYAEADATDVLTFTLNEDGVSYSVTGCNQTVEGELAIPSTYNGQPVTSIGGFAFYNCESLTSITIPDGVTSIGDYAFINCANLTDIMIPKSVTSIGGGAFSDCSHLTSITIPDGVTSIGVCTFDSCHRLASITIPDSVTSIGESAFSRCYSLTSITIPGGVTNIDEKAFFECSGLADVFYYGTEEQKNQIVIGSNNDALTSATWHYFVASGTCGENLSWILTEDGTLTISGTGAMDAFDWEETPWYSVKDSIHVIIIKDGVTSIGKYAFMNCGNLSGVTIPDGLTTIGDGAFWGCSSLASIAIPDGVTSIGYYAFMNCESLTSVAIPDGVTSIGDFAFSGCESLTSITIPDGVTSIGVCTFDSCRRLASITIPDSVTTIGDYAFYGCSSLTSVLIPNSVISIGSSAFSCCSSLESITIPFVGGSRKTALDTYQYPFGYIFGEDSYTGGVATEQYYYGSDTSSVTSSTYYIPKTLKTVVVTGGNILYGAFYNCSGLTSITIGDSVTSIGSSAFSGCSSLESITIPFVGGSRKTALDTYQYPFGYIFGEDSYTGGVATEQGYPGYFPTSAIYSTYYIPKSLKTVVITDGDILWGAFSNCGSLTSIVIPDGVTSIGDNAFKNCASLTDITIPDGVTTIGDYAFYGCSRLTSITIPKGVTTIDFYAFGDCRGLTNVTIPDSVTNIEDRAFENCSSLTSITIPDSVTSIGNGVFYNCRTLKSIAIPDSVTSIGEYIFSGCNSLMTVTIGNGVTTIGDSMFSGCSSLASITIPDSVTSIGDDAFHGCSSLISITIPDSVTWIGAEAFQSCSSLTSIAIPDSVTWIDEHAFSGCNSLRSVTIGNGVNRISNFAFSGCMNLTSITIPDSVTWIGEKTFQDCGSLKTVFYRGTESQRDQISIDSSNSDLTSATWHYEVEDAVFAEQDCLYCPACDNYYLPNGETVKATILFKNWDGTEHVRLLVEYKGDVKLPAEPTRPSDDDMYCYIFAGWDPEVVTSCTGNATYVATYRQELADCTVTFLDEDGRVISQNTYKRGDPVAVPADPTKAADNTYTYTFAGWDKDVVNCAGDATYTATYTPEFIEYMVKFLDEDGSIISEKTYHWGDNVTAPAAPTKAADNTYTYAFAGWDKEVVACAGDATYTATYTPTYIEYTVKFLDEDGTELSRKTYHWGDKVTAPADPTKAEDDIYTYTFAGWDKKVVPCEGNAIYTATYTRHEKTVVKIGEQVFGSLEDAIAAAKRGDKVVLQGNVEVATLVVPDGVALDLNGCELQAKYVVAFGNADFVDSVGGGLLKCRYVQLAANNSQMPVWAEADGGYRFFTLKDSQLYYTQSANGFTFIAKPILGKSANAVYMAMAGNGLTVKARMSWKSASGNNVEQFFEMKTEDVQKIYSDTNQIIMLTVNGAASYVGRLSTTMVIESETGVIWAGAPLLYTGGK